MWTRFRATSQQVWDLATDFSEVAACMPAGLHWEISDPEGLRRACTEPDERTWATRMRTPLSVTELPLRVTDVHPGLRFTFHMDNPWFPGAIHRHRFERAIGGHVRMVDELVLAPARWPGRMWVEGIRRARVAVHRGLSAQLDADPRTVGVSRVYTLAAGNAAHAQEALGDLPL